MVKNKHTFSKKWYLAAGNNFELSEEKGHEREAFQNFLRYKMDWGTMTIPHYVSDTKKLPPRQRYDFLYNLVQDRKGLSAYTKNKYLLEALECFSEMKSLGEIGRYDEWEAIHQNHFIFVCDALLKNATSYAKVQHSAAATVIRAATICDEVGFAEKRDMCLNSAEHIAKGIDSHYFFKRTGDEISLKKPWHDPEIESRLQKAEHRLLHDRTPGKMHGVPFYGFSLKAYPYRPKSHQRPNHLKPNLCKVLREIE